MRKQQPGWAGPGARTGQRIDVLMLCRNLENWESPEEKSKQFFLDWRSGEPLPYPHEVVSFSRPLHLRATYNPMSIGHLLRDNIQYLIDLPLRFGRDPTTFDWVRTGLGATYASQLYGGQELSVALPYALHSSPHPHKCGQAPLKPSPSASYTRDCIISYERVMTNRHRNWEFYYLDVSADMVAMTPQSWSSQHEHALKFDSFCVAACFTQGSDAQIAWAFCQHRARRWSSNAILCMPNHFCLSQW